VLSGPLTFTNQETTALPTLPPDPNRHIVYFRLSSMPGNGPAAVAPGPDAQIAPPRRVHGPMPGFATALPGPPGGFGRGGRGDLLFPDDLERVLKPMGAQIVNIDTPEAFRKTLASLIAEIAASQ
jgi:hypothetical protein